MFNKVPKSFQILDRVWTVELVPNLNSLAQADGLAQDDGNTISLDMGMDDLKLQQVFAHEFVHALLFSICKDKLNEDEELVELISRALRQAEQTLVYHEEQ
jgi:hypothetical protein